MHLLCPITLSSFLSSAMAEIPVQDLLWEKYIAADKDLVDEWNSKTTEEQTDVAELAFRVERDQLIRVQVLEIAQQHNGNPKDAGPLYAQVIKQMKQIDAENSAWIKKHIHQHGWFTISAYGEEASSNAFLLVQHSTSCVQFMTAVLTQLETLWPIGEVLPSDYAMLYDRVNRKNNGHQRYGTQMRCTNGTMVLAAPLEDTKTVDVLRSQVSLEPLEVYRASLTVAYGCGAQ